MEANNVSKIVVGFFMIIVGVVLIASVADGSALVTSQITIINETIDISLARDTPGSSINLTASNFSVTNAPTNGSWQESECVITGVIYGNATAIWTSGTDYTVHGSDGIIQVLNATVPAIESKGTNDTFASYTYCPDAYLSAAWQRTIMNLVAGFFALAILGIGLGLFYSVAKDAGILGK